MSNVRLSNGSPTLERMDAARLLDQPKPSACRSLFGPVDHEELKKELTGHLKAMEEAAADTWDFDFSTHTPRSSTRFLWKLVDSKDLPRFYSAQERLAERLAPTATHGLDLNGNHACRGVTAQTEERLPERTDKRRKTTALESPSCQTKRSRTCLDEAPNTPKKCSPPRPT